MASLTLHDVPDRVIARLRRRAAAEQRTLDEEAVRLLDAALSEDQTRFSDAYDALLKAEGPSPFGDEAFDAVFSGLRSGEGGRAVPFETE